MKTTAAQKKSKVSRETMAKSEKFNCFYTGVGSRKTPAAILKVMARIAAELQKKCFILRSGGADGADKAFESGVSDPIMKDIFYAKDATPEAMAMASTYHPAWEKCSDYVHKLHGRNAFQVFGKNLNMPSDFLICWTPDGCISHKMRTIKTGGTGTAISMADQNGIPVYNLARPDHLNFVTDWLQKRGAELPAAAAAATQAIRSTAMTVKTSNIRYAGKDKLDITVKSGAREFAPTWDMVKEYKQCRLSEEKYTKIYYNLMRKSYKINRRAWDDLLSRKSVTLTCYCKPGAFCHRKLFADILVKLGATYAGEVKA